MVVLGHFLTAVAAWDTETLRLIQTAIYSFHMPAFVLLAGITARSNRLAHRIGVLVVLLLTALPLYYWWMEALELDPEFEVLVPYWITWFLLSLAWWMLTVPLIERWPRLMLALSIAVAIFSGLIPEYDYELSLLRTLSFWVFFVLGRVYGAPILIWAGERRPVQRAQLVLAAAVPIAFFYLYDIEQRWFYGSRSFEWLDAAAPEGLVMRSILTLSAALTTLALLSLVPHRDGMLATIGRRSLAVYLLHGFVVRLFNRLWEDAPDLPETGLLVLVVTLSVLTTWVFSRAPFDHSIRTYAGSVTRVTLAPTERLLKHRRQCEPHTS